MTIVENALIELRARQSLDTPDNLQAFILARHVLGIMSLDDALDISMSAYVDEFYELADNEDLMDVDGMDIDIEDFTVMLEDALLKVIYPAGREMEHLANRVRHEPIPADLKGINNIDTQFLARACRLLQNDAGTKPFYLSQTNAGRLINKKRAAGGMKLKTLLSKKHLLLITKGYTGVASYYTCFEKVTDSYKSISL